MKTRFALAVAASLIAFPAAAQVTVTDPWVRSTVPAQKATGAFMKVKSEGDAKLVSAASPVAKVVEVHEMSMKDNVMQMRAIESLALPAGKTVELKPGGYHVMLMDLVKPIDKGAAVPITLTFVGKDGKKFTQEVKAEARAPGDDGSKHKGHKH
ncbi:MAG: copper chaperone PCu(A)C [Betaproteobacteria bacterium]|nr:copper chaperone PCu(A)C [Betaproteobacteria bacterium]